MKADQILTASLVDIVFEGRNKSYGAYELRLHYEQRILKALLVMGLVVTAVFIVLMNSEDNSKPQFRIRTVTSVSAIKPVEQPKPIEPPKETVKQLVKTEKSVAVINIVDKEFVTPPPTVDDLKNAQVGDTKQDGKDFINIVEPAPGPDNDKGVLDVKPADPGPLETVEIEAKYPGDWRKFLERNLNPEVPVSNSAPAGRYSVVIQFVVDKEGNVSDINALTAHGFGMEQEAIRVIKKAPKWEPAFQNGIHVKAYRRQVIVFAVNEE
jgi:protein TonB